MAALLQVEQWIDESLALQVPTTCLSSPPDLPAPLRGDGLPVALVSPQGTGGAELMTATLAAELQAMGFNTTLHNPWAPAPAGHPLAHLVDWQHGLQGIGDAAVVIWWGNTLQGYLDDGWEVQNSIHVVHSAGQPTRALLSGLRGHLQGSALVGVSGAAAELASEITDQPARVIWNGAADPGAPHCRPPSRGQYIVGCLGRYAPEKNLISAVGALSLLPADYRLRCYGPGPDRGKVYEAAQALGVADRVDLGGCLPDPARAWAEFDCLLLPSTYEGLPLVVPEAMLAGCPVVATPCCDLPLILEGRGTLTGPEPQEIADSLQATRADPDTITRAAWATLYAAHHLTAEAMARRYASLIWQVYA